MMLGSYDLPEVKANMNTVDMGLDFSKEVETYGSIQQDLSIKDLKSLIEQEPNNLVYLNELRLAMDTQIDDYIAFLQSLNVENEEIHLQTSLAYIDKLQDESLGTARLGQFSVLSINELNKLLEMNEHQWLAHYARGVNNLYWPIGLRRIDNAIEDLSYCVAVAEEYRDVENPMWASAYVAYGDALVKKGETDKGFKVWQDGLKRFPDDEELINRIESGKDQAFENVKALRGIDSFQRPEKGLTDLTILWERQ